jgi:AhpD family alkylhydroperoxidase
VLKCSHFDLNEENIMDNGLYPAPSKGLSRKRTQLAPEIAATFKAFNEQVFAEGALSVKTKQLIAVAVAHVTQCPYCIRSHTELALKHGATQRGVMEAIWVAAEMRAGGVYAHANLALETMDRLEAER